MAKYLITSPEGVKFEITAPDTATQEEVLSYAQQNMGQSVPSREKPSMELTPQEKAVRKYGATGYAAGKAAEAVKETISNIPESALEMGRGIGKTIIHPVQTVKAVGGLIGEMPEAITGGDAPRWTALGDLLKERYGSIENLNKTIINDPVGFAMDASAILGGAGAVAKGLGVVKIGTTLSAVGKAINPITTAGKVIIKPVIKGVGKVGKEVLGATTGEGKAIIAQAAINKPEFVQAMRGKISSREIVETAETALDEVRKARSADYTEKLAKVAKTTESINITPIKSKLDLWLNKFNIKRVTKTKQNPAGLDFERSALGLNPAAKTDVEMIVGKIDSWGTIKGDRTPIMLDILKRQLDDVYAQSSKVRAMVADMRNITKQTIINSKTVPDYAAMTANYEKSSKMIKEINSALSLKEGNTTTTALNKLNRAMRENPEFRRGLIQEMEAISGQNIQAQLAGITMKDIIPPQGIGRLIGAGELAFLGYFHPNLIPILLANSPRAVGEFFTLLKKPIGIARKISRTLPSTGQATFQASRLPPDIEAYKEDIEAKRRNLYQSKGLEEVNP